MEGFSFRGLTIRWEVQAVVAVLAAGLGTVVELNASTLAYRLVGIGALACAGVLGGLAAWPAVATVKVFLSHSVSAEERVVLLRLRDLASLDGIRVEISRRELFRDHAGKRGLPRRTKTAIDRSHLLLAIITSPIDLPTETELAYAKAKGKFTVPIVGPHVETRAVFARFPYMIRSFPEQSEDKIQAAAADFLQGRNVSKRVQKTVRAVVGISLALLSER